MSERDGRGPVRRFVDGDVPVWVGAFGLDDFHGFSGIVAVDGDGLDGEAVIDLDLPKFICVGDVSPGRVALKEEGGAAGDLSDSLELAEVPDGSGEDIAALMQEGSDIQGFEAPVGKVALGGAPSCGLAVDVKEEGVVGADADDEVIGLGGEIDGSLKVEDGGRVGREFRSGDPLSVPGLFGSGGTLGCAAAVCRDDDDDDGGEVPGRMTHSLSLISIPIYCVKVGMEVIAGFGWGHRGMIIIVLCC